MNQWKWRIITLLYHVWFANNVNPPHVLMAPPPIISFQKSRLQGQLDANNRFNGDEVVKTRAKRGRWDKEEWPHTTNSISSGGICGSWTPKTLSVRTPFKENPVDLDRLHSEAWAAGSNVSLSELATHNRKLAFKVKFFLPSAPKLQAFPSNSVHLFFIYFRFDMNVL